MKTNEARKLFDEKFPNAEYVAFRDMDLGEVCLDGRFTLAELKYIVELMEQVNDSTRSSK